MYIFETREALEEFIIENIIDTSQAVKILDCSRQNIDDLIKREKLKPITNLSKTKIFWKEDILQRKNIG